MEHDALVMVALRPRDPLGYSLRAVAWRQLGRYERAIDDYDSAIRLTAPDDPRYVDLNAQRCDALMAMGQYDRVVADARRCLELVEDTVPLEFRLFCALTALGDYEQASPLFQRVTESNPAAQTKLREWSMKYVFDTLEAGRAWHPPESEPEGMAFLPMLEAQRTYRNLSAKARRVVTDAFTARRSPDGTKLAFSTGFHGYSGVAVLDTKTGQTDLLIVPGKDPDWSPDGHYLAFVRDCQALPVSELAVAERESRPRAFEDEEVWIMKADGTEPRRLASGGWPRWSRDPNHIYFHSRSDSAICKMSIEGTNATPQKVLKCPDLFPVISPDSRYVACVEGNSLKILKLASASLFAELTLPTLWYSGKTWSSDSRELCFYAGKFDEIPSGLWVYSLDKKQTSKVLETRVRPISMAPDGTELVFNLGAPYFEIWVADLDPNVGIVDSLGSDLICEQYCRDKLALYAQRIEANPEDANNYFVRALFHDSLGKRALANADMRRWSAVAGGRQPSDSSSAERPDFKFVLSLPCDCQLVFSAESPVNMIPTMSLAFGQKGRRQKQLFEIPMCITSLFGLGLTSGSGTEVVQADYTFGTPICTETNFVTAPSISTDGLTMYGDAPDGSGWSIWVKTRETIHDDWPVIASAIKPTPPNSSYSDGNPDISADNLTLIFSSRRPGGLGGGSDIWQTTRVSTDDPWSEPVNLGPTINSPYYDTQPCISADGLSLVFSSDRPGGYGDRDIYLSTRATVSDPWLEPMNLGPIVNSPSSDSGPDISSDGLTLFFDSRRPGGYGLADIYVTRRATTDAAWGAPVNLGPIVNDFHNNYTPCISADGSILHWWSQIGRLRQVAIIPIVDFDGDGIADSRD